MKVGLIIGSGTGRELAEIFKHSLSRIAQMIGKQVEIVECQHEFKSYKELRNLTPEQIEEIVREDLETLSTFYKSFYESGGRTIFRTAINAETLYLFRRLGKAVKVIQIPMNSNRTLLIVRDEMQGFYTQDKYQIEPSEIHFVGSFSRENFKLIANFAVKEAERVLRKPFEVWVVYKHHLFANVLENWARQFIPEAHVYQPNHATELLFKYFGTQSKNDLLMIMGNEIGDILHEVLIFHLGLGTRNTLFSKNVYLHPDYEGLVEYQTVHGSADDIAGRNIVNPFATLRVVGALVEEFLHENGFSAIMESALLNAEKVGIVSPDMGGYSMTNDVVEYVLSCCESTLRSLIVRR